MFERECFVCKEYIENIVTIRLFDDKESVEFSCHEECANTLWDRLQKVKDMDKKPVTKVLKELKINVL
jgi:hypothetical protein